MKLLPRLLAIAIVIALASLVFASARAQSTTQSDQPTWYSLGEDGIANVDLYFFWSETCPHCREAHPYIMALPDELPWLRLHSFELNTNQQNSQLYVELARAVGQEAMYVPAFIYCGTMQAGYDSHETTGAALRDDLIACQEKAQTELSGGPASGTATKDVVRLPVVGAVDAAAMSLPVLTLLIAGVDSINPCAIFVLMFLLSLMVHAKNRSRMLLIGFVFVLFSGLIYFAIMGAWLKLFEHFGELRLITLAAGLVAVVIAAINIKDYFWYKQGVSLSIPESAKPGLYARSRNLVYANSFGAVLAGTVLLAISANAYEALCTAGFPMVYTRILTMAELPSVTYWSYLVAYNVIYVIPLLTIVILFAVFLGSRKLGEREGRALKLVSGLMMLMLGIVLVAAPDQLNNMRISVTLVAGALIAAVAIVTIDRKRQPKAQARHARRARAH